MISKTERIVRENSPTILTALGVSGTITTAYLAFKAGRQVEAYEAIYTNPPTKKDWVKEHGQKILPVGISASLTIACIIGASRTNSRRTAAITAAYSVTERAFAEYKEKIVEQLGERKEQSVRDDIAQDKVNRHPTSKEVIIVASGNVLCYEAFTGRYFTSDMESLRKAQNDVNAKLLSQDEATLSDFYYIVGLPYTNQSGLIGWTSEKQMKLDISTTLAEDNRPCLVIEYNYTKPL